MKILNIQMEIISIVIMPVLDPELETEKATKKNYCVNFPSLGILLKIKQYWFQTAV